MNAKVKIVGLTSFLAFMIPLGAIAQDATPPTEQADPLAIVRFAFTHDVKSANVKDYLLNYDPSSVPPLVKQLFTTGFLSDLSDLKTKENKSTADGRITTSSGSWVFGSDQTDDPVKNIKFTKLQTPPDSPEILASYVDSAYSGDDQPIKRLFILKREGDRWKIDDIVVDPKPQEVSRVHVTGVDNGLRKDFKSKLGAR